MLAALRQNGLHRGAADRDGGVLGDLDLDEILAHLGDLADQTAHGLDLVALAQALDQLLMFLLALDLRTNHKEVHDHEHADQEQQRHAVSTGYSGSTLGHGVGNQETHGKLRFLISIVILDAALCHSRNGDRAWTDHSGIGSPRR